MQLQIPRRTMHVSFISLLIVSAVELWVSDGAELAGGYCQQNELKRCTDPLKILTNNRDLGFATTHQELGSLCPELLEGLDCIDKFTLRCLDSTHRDFFHMLYAGTKQVIVDLCQDDHYQQEYLDHAPCMRVVQAGYEQCAADYQNQMAQTADDGSTTNPSTFEIFQESTDLCCSFKQYLNCSHAVVMRKCGQQTAKFTSGFLNTMAGPLIQGYCQNYEPGTCDPTSSDASTPPPASERSDVADPSHPVTPTPTTSVQFTRNSASDSVATSASLLFLTLSILLS